MAKSTNAATKSKTDLSPRPRLVSVPDPRASIRAEAIRRINALSSKARVRIATVPVVDDETGELDAARSTWAPFLWTEDAAAYFGDEIAVDEGSEEARRAYDALVSALRAAKTTADAAGPDFWTMRLRSFFSDLGIGARGRGWVDAHTAPGMKVLHEGTRATMNTERRRLVKQWATRTPWRKGGKATHGDFALVSIALGVAKVGAGDDFTAVLEREKDAIKKLLRRAVSAT
jgi:hypothetical protein